MPPRTLGTFWYNGDAGTCVLLTGIDTYDNPPYPGKIDETLLQFSFDIFFVTNPRYLDQFRIQVGRFVADSPECHHGPLEALRSQQVRV